MKIDNLTDYNLEKSYSPISFCLETSDEKRWVKMRKELKEINKKLRKSGSKKRVPTISDLARPVVKEFLDSLRILIDNYNKNDSQFSDGTLPTGTSSLPFGNHRTGA